MGKRKQHPPPIPMGNRPTVRLKSNRYQPSKAELNEEIHLDATPEELARAVLRDVNIEREE